MTHTVENGILYASHLQRRNLIQMVRLFNFLALLSSDRQLEATQFPCPIPLSKELFQLFAMKSICSVIIWHIFELKKK